MLEGTPPRRCERDGAKPIWLRTDCQASAAGAGRRNERRIHKAAGTSQRLENDQPSIAMDALRAVAASIGESAQ
jgi:hypothetical protein